MKYTPISHTQAGLMLLQGIVCLLVKVYQLSPLRKAHNTPPPLKQRGLSRPDFNYNTI